MTEEFFERLRERADSSYCGEEILSWHSGIKATIEALKKMMVGEPMEMRLRHYRVGPLEDDVQTEFCDMKRGSNRPFRRWGLHGTDGEEVVVLVVYL